MAMPWLRDSRGEREVNLFAVDLHCSLIVGMQAGNDLDQCRLARSIVAEHTCHLTGVDDHVDSLEGSDRSVGLANIDHFDQRLTLVQCRIGVFLQSVGHNMPTFLIVESRFTYRLTITASNSMTPRNALNQFGSQPA